ncbi:hypothetical protein [Novosphingobium sp. FKTRR1]|uniref:hypothetical protein n=1 Tax=Novosphingobium sp. FKTRR1 TaxID=2879118 RepID=UPI001CF0211B|nr:hypothetical protein [Novosphingobium sp. FKTRR1]
MAKYPPRTCRACGAADWVWSDKTYPEGKPRIIVQQPGSCRSEDPSRKAASAERLKAMEPYRDCAAWEPVRLPGGQVVNS